MPPDGVGLAATQVDVHERVIVMDTSEQHDQPLVLINPEIVERSEETSLERGRLPVGAADLRPRRAPARVTRAGAGPRRRSLSSSTPKG